LNDFRPLPLLRGGHRQTLAGHFARRWLRWKWPTEDLVIHSADGTPLLVRASWQPGVRRETPALLLVHGLEGNDRSGYMLSAGEAAFRRGWHVLRMNLRGCGDGEALSAKLYNAGLTDDLIAVMCGVHARVEAFAVCGFSLGANLALLAAGRYPDALPPTLRAITAISPPLDLAACAEALDRPHNWLYRAYFLKKLGASYRRRQRLLPELYARELDRPYRSIRDYDQAITARYGGYRDVEDYYARSSSGPWLNEVPVPALILAAEDDPMIPIETVTRWPAPRSLEAVVTPSGGHVGFWGDRLAPSSFWPALRAIDFAWSAVAS
jgi:hypothetical protein